MRALVISGGGCKGAFAVGAIEHLLELGHSWDIIVGTSTGALIAPLVASGHFERIKHIYSNVYTRNIIRKYCWLTLPWRSAIYNDRPLQQIIEANYTLEMHNHLQNGADAPEVAVCTVNLNSGKTCYWSPKDCSWEEFCVALSASSNQPGLMPPRKLRGDYHVDGGVREVVPVSHAIGFGATSITAIVLEPEGARSTEKEFDRLPGILLRTLDLMITEIRKDDMPELEFVVIRPDEVLIDDSLRFKPEEMREMIRKGYKAAQDAIG